MRFRFLILCLLLVGCMPIAATQQPVQHNPLETRVHSVTLVYQLGERGFFFRCAGGVIDYRGYKRVVSTAHCIMPDVPLFVQANGKTYPATILEKRTEYNLDWMILASDAVDDIPAAPLSTTELIVGDEVYSWQQPHGYSPILSQGIFQGRLTPVVTDDKDWFISLQLFGFNLVSFDSDLGASGSLVFNEGGKVVGMVKGGLNPLLRLGSTFIVDVPQ
jgi:S1-C subfamily serine protease